MSEIDLYSLFNSVSEVLQENQASLNKADDRNGDHGDNMVEIFNTISKAVKEKDTSGVAGQLSYASEILSNKQSGSAQLYAQGLSQAASQFQGQGVTQQNAIQLVQTLMGAGETAPADNSIEGLLGGLLGGGKDDDAGIDAGDLLNAGMAFLSAKQRGDSNIEALVDAVVSASPLSQTPHRQQSSQLVVNTLMQQLGKLGGN
jgi:hypothetical protein